MHNVHMYLYTDMYVDCMFHFACMKFLVTINLGMRTYVLYVCVMNSLSMYIRIISFLRVKRYTPPETLSSFFDEEETLLKPSSAEKKGNGKISVVEMYMPSARSLPIFQHFGFK